MATSIFLESATQATYDFAFFLSTGGTVTSDATVTRKGPRSIKMSTGSPAVTARTRRSGVLADAGRRISCWFRTDTLPAGTSAVLDAQDNTGSGVVQLSLRSTGKIEATPLGATAVAGTTVLAVNTWYRLTLSYTITNTTTFTVKVYVNGNLEATANSGTLTRTGTDRLSQVLVSTAGANVNSWFSDLYVDNGTDLADPGNIGVTYKAPASNNVNNFNVAIGANPANRWTNVNERPISTTNGWSDQSGTPQNENYGLQTASQGDVDLTGHAIIARTAWLWALQGFSVAGTPKITDNGTDTAITLTTSAALYTVTTDSTSYPSNAAGIGMVSAGVAIDATNLYECGTLIAYNGAVTLTASDAPSTSESLTRIETLLRTASDAPLTTDAVARVLTLLRTAADAASTTDSLTRLLTLLRTASDAPLTTDSVARVLALLRTVADSPLTMDAVSRLLALLRTAGDSPLTTDALTRLLSLLRSVADSPQTTDSVIGPTTQPRTASDAPQTSDAIARVLTLLRTASDLPTTTDAVSRLLALLRSAVDAPTSTDAASRTVALLRSASDSPTTMDAVSRALTLLRLAADAASTTDAAAQLLSLMRAASDSPSTADAISEALALLRSAADAPMTGDAVSRAVALLRTVADSPETTDAATVRVVEFIYVLLRIGMMSGGRM